MNRIIINVNNFQKRAAIIEEGRVVEVLTEREDESNIIKIFIKGGLPMFFREWNLPLLI